MSPYGRICVSIAERDSAAAVAAARRCMAHADVVEIRLDAMADPNLESMVAALDRPLLFTCRPRWEGGLYEGGEEARIDLLIRAADLGAYVDLELAAATSHRSRLRKACAASGCTLLLSQHDFTATPERTVLEGILAAMIDAGAEVGKIVTTAHGPEDVVRVLGLQIEAGRRGFPLCAFCMGKAGRISRVATLALGGFMSYAAPDREHATAPGQLEVADLRHILALMG